VPRRRLDGHYVFIAAKDESIHTNHEAVTDSEGTFRIEGLVPVRFEMNVHHATGTLHRELVVPATGEVIETPDLVLESGLGRLRVVIGRPEDRPELPAGAHILLVGYRHRVRTKVIPLGDPYEKIVEPLPPDLYAVVLVREKAVKGGGRFSAYLSQFALVEVTADATGRVTLIPRKK